MNGCALNDRDEDMSGRCVWPMKTCAAAQNGTIVHVRNLHQEQINNINAAEHPVNR